MNTNISEKVIVITGASSGIGLATAKKLSEQGAIVSLGARRIDRLEVLVEEVKTSIDEMRKMSIPAVSIANAIAYAIAQPEDVDTSEIIIRPTSQPM